MANPQTQSKPQAKKASTKGIGIILVIVFVVALLAVLILSVTKNLFGVRDAVMDYLGSMDPEYQTMAEREAALEEREQDLAQQEEAILAKEEDLESQQADLEAQQDGLEAQQAEFEVQQQEEKKNLSSFEEYIAGLTEERRTQLKQIASIYSNMDNDQAAEALAQLGTVESMAVVIYYMSEENAAELMDVLDVKTVASITQFMLG